MLTIKRLKELLAALPDDATAAAYEGEKTGLTISHGDKYGFIETGSDTEMPSMERHEGMHQ